MGETSAVSANGAITPDTATGTISNWGRLRSLLPLDPLRQQPHIHSPLSLLPRLVNSRRVGTVGQWTGANLQHEVSISTALLDTPVLGSAELRTSVLRVKVHALVFHAPMVILHLLGLHTEVVTGRFLSAEAPRDTRMSAPRVNHHLAGTRTVASLQPHPLNVIRRRGRERRRNQGTCPVGDGRREGKPYRTQGLEPKWLRRGGGGAAAAGCGRGAGVGGGGHLGR